MHRFQTGDIVCVISDTSRHKYEIGVVLHYCKNGQSSICAVYLFQRKTVINFMETSLLSQEPVRELHIHEETAPDVLTDWAATEQAIASTCSHVHTTQVSLLSCDRLERFQLYFHSSDGNVMHIRIGAPVWSKDCLMPTDDLGKLWTDRKKGA